MEMLFLDSYFKANVKDFNYFNLLKYKVNKEEKLLPLFYKAFAKTANEYGLIETNEYHVLDVSEVYFPGSSMTSISLMDLLFDYQGEVIFITNIHKLIIEKDKFNGYFKYLFDNVNKDKQTILMGVDNSDEINLYPSHDLHVFDVNEYMKKNKVNPKTKKPWNKNKHHY